MLLEFFTLLPVLGFLGFNFNQQKSNAKSESGLRGTDFFQPTAEAASNALIRQSNLGNEVMASPYGSFRGQTGAQMFNPGQFGLGTAADDAVNKMLTFSLNRMSASGAGRGQLSPENTPGIAASATRQVLPSLLPQISQMAQWIYQLPEQWKNSLFNYGSQLVGQYAPFLGAQSSSSSSGIGVGAQVGGDSVLPKGLVG